MLNYSGAVFGDRLDSLEGNAGEVHLVNEDGYWLHAPDPSLEWGFMFDDGSSFAASLPETWEQLRTTQAVEGISAAGRFAATTLRPMAHEDVADLRPGASRVRAPYTWKLITLQPEERLAGMLHAHLLRALLELGLATLLLGPLAWGYVESRERRRRALAELVASERRFASVTDSIPDAIVTVDRAEKVLTWNRAAAEIFGLGDSDVAGMPISWLVRNTEPRRATRLLDLPPGQQREMVGMRNDGKGFPLEVAVGNWTDESDEFISIVGRDITARREAEDTKQNLETELLHARKLEAVGQLAAGIAHEINTPTQFVGDNTRFLKDAFGDVEQLIAENRRLIEDLEAAGSAELAGRLRETMEEADVEFLEEEVPRAIDQSLEGLGRVGKIVSAMKEFAHPGSQGKTAADLNHCIESTVTVATNEWKYACDMELQLDPTLPSVVCSAGEINQVVLNMVVNAAHAVEEQLGERPTEKGLISISTETARDHVEIRIGDSGSGMPPEVRDRIFDPFFTTKAVGKGSGQGLAIAHDVVVRKHGGTIQVESEPGHGTTFIVRLPLQPNEQPDPTLEEATP